MCLSSGDGVPDPDRSPVQPVEMLWLLDFSPTSVLSLGSRSLAINHHSARSALALAITGLSLIAMPAKAGEKESAAGEVERWSILVTYGDDDCPESTSSEIVVCANRPEEERYRIPKDIRDKQKEEQAHYATSWTSQFQNHEDEARLGRPNSCSPVGTNGFSGCQAAMLRDWFAQRGIENVDK